MKTLSESDLKEFQIAIEKDYGIKLKEEELYQSAFNILKFFDSLLDFDIQDKENKSKKVRKSS